MTRRLSSTLPPACAARALLVAAALAAAGGAHGATIAWSGAGANDFWNNSANWTGGVVPANGDAVVFGVAGGGDSLLNYTLSLDTFRFAPAILPEHNFYLVGGSSLSLTGFGIDNVSRIPAFGEPPIPPGVIRQQLYMDAGATITFQNSATIGGSDPVFNLPVDLNALGGRTTGAVGGRIVFEDASSASGPPAYTFTGLRISGALVAGAHGGELRFREDASMGFTAAFAIHPGEVAGAEGGTAIFEGHSIAESGSNTNATGAGLGGRVVFRENAVANGGFGLNNYGAATLDVGNEAIAQFLDDSVLDAFAQNFGGQNVGMPGGRTEFRQRAAFGGPGGGYIFNAGSALGGEGGRTIFYDDARILGTAAIIANRTENEGPQPGSIGGVTEFRGASRAGQATIYNSGASSGAAGTLGARTLFRENSSAESATIFAGGGSRETGAVGSSVEFSGAATAASATLTAQSGTDGGLGGKIVLSETASGGTAKVTAELGGVFDMSALTTGGTTLGSIAGAGDFFLGSKSLTVGSSGLTTEVAGSLRDGGIAGGVGASLTKVGAGTLSLGGANTYTGATTVSGGGLLVNGSLASSGVSVAGDARLGGAGVISGPVAVANAGILSPGPAGTFGTLATGPLNLAANAVLDYQLRGNFYDQVAVNGALTLDGVLNIAAPTGLTLGVYRLIDYTGPLTNNGLTIGAVPAGITAGDFTILTNTPGQVNLQLGGDADLLYWDGPQTAPNNAVNGGSGVWNNMTTNWTNAAGSVQRAWNGRTAVFAGPADTATLGENIAVRGMQFVTNNYAVAPGAGSTIALDGAAAVRVDAALATVSAALGGGGQLVKTGAGQLRLTAASNYTGGTIVQDGVLQVTDAAGLGLGSGPVTVRESPTTYLAFTGAGSAGSLAIANEGSSTSNSGFVQFLGSSTAASAIITNAGNIASEGFGAYTQFDNSARAGAATIHNLGASFSSPTIPGYTTEGSGRTTFGGSATADAATITNFAGAAADLQGGQTRFFGSATAGSASILNRGGAVAGALGGVTEFTNFSTAGSATITLEGGPDVAAGGTVRFLKSSTGGVSRIVFASAPGTFPVGTLDISGSDFTAVAVGSIEGNGFVALGGKRLEFGGNNLATAFAGQIYGSGSLRKVGTNATTLSGSNTYSGGTIVDSGTLRVTSPSGLGLGTGQVTVMPGSLLRFDDDAASGSRTIQMTGATSSSGSGSTIYFTGNSTAQALTVVQPGAEFVGPYTNPVTWFFDSSSAGGAFFFNNGGRAGNSSSGANGGNVVFLDNSKSGSATFLNYGGEVAGSGQGYVQFLEQSNAENANITNYGSSTRGYNGLPNGGETNFTDQASAGIAQFTNFGATAATGSPGRTRFFNNASAGSATFLNRPGAVLGAEGGNVRFQEFSTAGSANFENFGATFGTFAPGEAGLVRFVDNASAGAATFLNRPGAVENAFGGSVNFENNSTAGAAQIENRGANTFAPGFGGRTYFLHSSTAGSATIVNRGSQAAAVNPGETAFTESASAGAAEIFVEGSQVTGGVGAYALFWDNTTAANAKIHVAGSTRALAGGHVWFSDAATAGAATLDIGGSSAAGGVAQFFGTSSGGQARAILAGSGAGSADLDVSTLSIPGTTLGSIEGPGGVIHLGSKRLTVGGNDLSTNYTGILADGGSAGGAGGSLTKVGAGNLTLAGANTYTGLTTVDAGTLLVNGSLAGNAQVNAGATLGGTGTIAGAVTVAPGGILAPGLSPGTLSVGSLALANTSILNFEFGVVSDLVVVAGNLTLDGVLNVAPGLAIDGFGREIFAYSGALVDNGLQIGSVPPGFSPDDFQFDFSVPGRVGVIVAPVSPPAGDFDSDLLVTGADFLAWQRGRGKIVGALRTDGDADADGDVDAGDLALWQTNFGSVNLPGQSPVPEPASVVIALAALVVAAGPARRNPQPPRRRSLGLLRKRRINHPDTKITKGKLN